MKNLILATIAALTVLTTSAISRADAGIFLEPGVTFQLANEQVNWPDPANNSTGHINGFGLVGRAGYHFTNWIFAALDARYGVPHFTDSSTNYSASATSYQYGPVVGVQMPYAGLRAWVGYVADGELDPGASGNYDVKFRNATGFNIGGGIHVGPVSLNLEYQKLSYANTDFQKVWINTNATSSVHMHSDQVIASVTFPFEF